MTAMAAVQTAIVIDDQQLLWSKVYGLKTQLLAPRSLHWYLGASCTGVPIPVILSQLIRISAASLKILKWEGGGNHHECWKKHAVCM